jgi:hypothetical protein
MEPTPAPASDPTPPAPPPAPPVTAALPTPGPLGAAPRWPGNVIRISTVVAWTAVAAIATGVALFLAPVKNEHGGHTIQDCGVPVAYLWQGRSSAVVDPSSLPAWIAKADLGHVNDHQCSQQVADRAVPGGGLLVGGFVIGVVALLLAWIGHRAEHRSHWHPQQA